MASITMHLVGGPEFLVDLERWRGRLQSQAANASARAAERIMARAQAKYPLGKTGNLRNGVIVTVSDDGTTATALARSGAPHSHLYEFGTKLRTYRGANRGRMIARPVFIPIAIQERAAFHAALVQIMDSPEPALGEWIPGVQVTQR